MAYKNKYVVNEKYSFYNNSDDLEDNGNFASWRVDLLNDGSFTVAASDIWTPQKDIISGTDYRYFFDNVTFPNVPGGCYRIAIIDTADSDKVLYLSDVIETVSNDTDLICVKYRNSVNILDFNYETLTNFYNVCHVELKGRKPANPKITEGYDLSTGSFKRIRTIATKTWEFITGWFDGTQHEAMELMLIHNDVQFNFQGQYNQMNLTDESEYLTEYQEDYDYIQGSVRLEQNARSTSNATT